MSNLEVHMETQRLAVMATEAIENAMDLASLNRSQLADLLGISKPRVTKALDGESNITLKTLAQFGLACGVRWHFVGVKAGDPSAVVIAPHSLGHLCRNAWTQPQEEAGQADLRTENTTCYGLAA